MLQICVFVLFVVCVCSCVSVRQDQHDEEDEDIMSVISVKELTGEELRLGLKAKDLHDSNTKICVCVCVCMHKHILWEHMSVYICVAD